MLRLAFHPQFAKNRYVYVSIIFDGLKRRMQLPDGTRISRFKMTDTDPPRIDPKSETVLLTFMGGGHNGCDMHFGNDGFLYISSGDAASPNPPDVHDVGQNMGSLLSKILRIDVDRSENGKVYAIPPDNPFVGLPGARPETYAYGFRNPWRMSFDRPTGDLWVGDVGWELWEMVYRVKKGGNYGWSIKEGRQDIRPNAKRGPTPILPPNLDFPHTEAASITGGYVYHGKQFPSSPVPTSAATGSRGRSGRRSSTATASSGTRRSLRGTNGSSRSARISTASFTSSIITRTAAPSTA